MPDSRHELLDDAFLPERLGVVLQLHVLVLMASYKCAAELDKLHVVAMAALRDGQALDREAVLVEEHDGAGFAAEEALQLPTGRRLTCSVASGSGSSAWMVTHRQAQGAVSKTIVDATWQAVTSIAEVEREGGRMA